MATIRERRRADGSVAFLADIRIKRQGTLLYRETQTFDTKALAKAWASSREKSLRDKKAYSTNQPHQRIRTLHDLLKKYRSEVSSIRPMGRSKTGHIKFLEKCEIAGMSPQDLRASDIIQHIRKRRQSGTGPSTVNNDLIWLRVILRYARAAWDVPFDMAVIDHASEILRAEKLVSKSRKRVRRPSETELQKLSEYFHERDTNRSSIPMKDIMWFAIYSARRQAEIMNLLHTDNDPSTQTGVVRNLKHPTERNFSKRFKYQDEAWEIVCRQPKSSPEVFPYDPKTVGTIFRNACKKLEISDLRFHDLRHEATSRLFEAGYSIVEVQQFTLHDSWNTLSRYTQLRPESISLKSLSARD